MTVDNRYLITESINGNTEAFKMLVEKYKNAVHTQALMITNDAAEAEDIAQETFIKAYDALPGLKDLDAFGGWLKTIAKNFSFRALRRRMNSKVKILDPDDLLNIVPKAETVTDTADDNRSELADAIKNLPECARFSPFSITANASFTHGGTSVNRFGGDTLNAP